MENQESWILEQRAYEARCAAEDKNRKEAARRIVEMCGELHLSLNDLDCVRDYLRQHAGLTLVD